MRIVNNLENFNELNKPIFLGLGNFDGIHRGHRAVINNIISQAKENSGHAWIFTFDPHPARIIKKTSNISIIMTDQQRVNVLKKMGVNGMIIHKFDEEFMKLYPEDFFNLIVKNIPNIAGISVGKNWSFGKDRLGNTMLMRSLCKKKNINFYEQEEIIFDGQRISSTRIRNAIKNGNIKDATKMIGGPFSISGRIIHGEKIGRQLGYPTANIESNNECLPALGVYAATLSFDDNEYEAALYIGSRSTIHNNKPIIIEAHIINENNLDLYNKNVEVIFNDYIRGDIKFDTVGDLIKQIKSDVDNIKKNYPSKRAN